MELSEIREKIDAVDEQLLDLFLQRMDLSDEVAAYKNAHHLPILNKERERAILAKVTEKSGERERYAYHLFSTLFELARSRQAELISAPTKVAAQVRASLEAGTSVFPQTGLVACQGVEGANSQVACDRLLPRDLPGCGVRCGVWPVQVRRAAYREQLQRLRPGGVRAAAGP